MFLLQLNFNMEDLYSFSPIHGTTKRVSAVRIVVAKLPLSANNVTQKRDSANAGRVSWEEGVTGANWVFMDIPRTGAKVSDICIFMESNLECSLFVSVLRVWSPRAGLLSCLHSLLLESVFVHACACFCMRILPWDGVLALSSSY